VTRTPSATDGLLDRINALTAERDDLRGRIEALATLVSQAETGRDTAERTAWRDLDRATAAGRELDRLRAENAELLSQLDDRDQAAAAEKAPRGPEFDLVIFDETADFRPDSSSDAADPAVVLEPLDDVAPDVPAAALGWRRRLLEALGLLAVALTGALGGLGTVLAMVSR